ncbi:MAG: TRAP transporter fused permease subunit [Spirochaetota bacterium]|nr:TRAP transporter fused permease subunit [Spirochaetota bacterium]
MSSDKLDHQDLTQDAKKKVDTYLKKENSDQRSLSGFWKWLVFVLSFVLVFYYIGNAGYIWKSDFLSFDFLMEQQFNRGVYVLITFLLIFLLIPFSGKLKESEYSPVFRVIFSVISLSVITLWISSSFAIPDIKAKPDLGYMVSYIAGALIFIYLLLFLSFILKNNKQDTGTNYLINIILLILASGLSLYWIITFISFHAEGQAVNTAHLADTISFFWTKQPLGQTQSILGWLTTATGVLLLIYTFAKPLLKSPTSPKALHRPTISDILFAILTIIAIGYWIYIFPDLHIRSGNENDMDYLIGLLGIIISLEVARRVLGWSLMIIGVLMLLYAYFGQHLPEIIQHSGQSPKQISVKLFIHSIGIFGTMAYVMANYVILFIFFGAFLRLSGATQFFIDFALALAGRSIGGPAKVSVIASALFGSISGSAIANTVSTGVFTIPLMKRAGFKPHVAGAIEPSASIAGMFLPPVMGAGGFLMAELTDTPYATIMAVAIFPALMYLWGVYTMIHFEAKKNKLSVVKDLHIPKVREVLRERWYMSLPLLVITWMMVGGFSPGNSAFWGIVTCVIILLVNRGLDQGIPYIIYPMYLLPAKIIYDLFIYLTNKVIALPTFFISLQELHIAYYGVGISGLLTVIIYIIYSKTLSNLRETFVSLIKGIWNSMILGTQQTLIIGATVGVIGIIVGTVELTDLAKMLTDFLLNQSGNKLILVIILVAIASLILGMGVPVTAAYYITVALVAPIFNDLGVSLIAAHMIVYWFSQDSNITPPVCIAAYAGAAIAESNPWKTGWTAFKYAKMLYVMPILFAYVPGILLNDSIDNILIAMVSCFLGTIAFSSLSMFYLVRKTLWYEWVLLVPVTILLFWPSVITTVIGLGLFIGLYYNQKRRNPDPVPV